MNIFRLVLFRRSSGLAFKNIKRTTSNICRSQWPRSLRRGPAAVRLLGLRIRIQPGAWMSVVNVVCCQVEVSCVGHIARPGESYRVWRVWVWSWNLNSEEALAHWGYRTMKKKSNIYLYMYSSIPWIKVVVVMMMMMIMLLWNPVLNLSYSDSFSWLKSKACFRGGQLSSKRCRELAATHLEICTCNTTNRYAYYYYYYYYYYY
jgi:hypothetical protein